VLLVVFGAGASYDSDPDHIPPDNPNERVDTLSPIEQARPPLANRLFDNRPQFLSTMGAFPECLALIPRLRKSGVAVEKELAKLQAEASDYPERHRQLAAIRCYLRRALWECQDRWRGVHRGVTNYATLLDEIERWRFQVRDHICFVTFNYDTMLEEAMAQVVRLQVHDMDSYRSWEHYSLFKLHGSIDWGRVVAGIGRQVGGPIPPYQNLISIANPGNITDSYLRCEFSTRPTPDTGAVLFPALSIPVENKDEFSCPHAHVTTLKGLLPDVTKMITIGWRATEHDFLKMLRASRSDVTSGIRQPLELLIVTGSKEGAEQTAKNLGDYGIEQLLEDPDRARVTTGFTGLINNLETLGTFLCKGLYHS